MALQPQNLLGDVASLGQIGHLFVQPLRSRVDALCSSRPLWAELQLVPEKAGLRLGQSSRLGSASPGSFRTWTPDAGRAVFRPSALRALTTSSSVSEEGAAPGRLGRRGRGPCAGARRAAGSGTGCPPKNGTSCPIRWARRALHRDARIFSRRPSLMTTSQLGRVGEIEVERHLDPAAADPLLAERPGAGSRARRSGRPL